MGIRPAGYCVVMTPSKVVVFLEWFASLYNPQRHENRWVYLRSLSIALAIYLIVYNVGMALADWEEGVSDEMLVWIGQYPIPLITNLLLFFTMAATARRLHDMGFGGAGALLLCLPEPWFVLIPLGLLMPSRSVSRETPTHTSSLME